MLRLGRQYVAIAMCLSLVTGCEESESETSGLTSFTSAASQGTDTNGDGDGDPTDSAETGGGTMDSDASGDGDADTSGDGDSSGDGDTSASTSGDGDTSASTSGDGDGDPTTTSTSGDGDPTTTSTSTTSTTGDGDGDGDGDTPCTTDADCAMSLDGPVCDAGACVECTPSNDVCSTGYFCDVSNTCIFGCINDGDCINSAVGPICDVANTTCVECTVSQDLCPVGQFCDSNNSCIVGCSDDSDCANSTVGPFCETTSNACVACTPTNDVCPPGQICGTNFTCVTGCTADSDCVGSATGTICEANECVECTPTNDLCAFGEYCTAANECVFGCADDTDCIGVVGLPICSTSNLCVECTPTNDQCPPGEYCDASDACVVGCLDNTDCQGSTTCNTTTNTCEGCFADSDCTLGSICSDPVNGGQCVPGCNAQQLCAGTDECCNGNCVDLNTDPDNCSACDFACDIPNADATCLNGNCELAACIGNFNDCNQDAVDGCETSQACLCIPGEVQPCYTGPSVTQNVGACADGTRTCNAAGSAFSSCTGQTLPSQEVCGDDVDNDCNGFADEFDDPDLDGFPICDANGVPIDCCEDFTCAGDPAAVNPGAYDIPNNGVDEDCSGSDATTLETCDGMLDTQPTDTDDLARAIDLCTFTEVSTNFWGVTATDLTTADGAQAPADISWSVRGGFGNNISPRKGDSLLVLSTGTAADKNDNNPGWSAFQDGTVASTYLSGMPKKDPNGGGATFKSKSAPNCTSGNNSTIRDTVNFTLTVRVPSNAQSFSTDIYFFSSEYPEYVCTNFNDFFIGLLAPVGPNNPQDGNIAIYDTGTNVYPVGVNLLQAAPGLFTQCQNADYGLYQNGGGPFGSGCGAPQGTYNSCVGTSELTGTGFDETTDTDYDCDYVGMHGGGTGWLTMTGNVTPGELQTIQFVIWDQADPLFDSVVLIDNWEWSASPAQPGVQPG